MTRAQEKWAKMLCLGLEEKKNEIWKSLPWSFLWDESHKNRKIKTFLHSSGHLRFMRGYLSPVAPSFSNQEHRAHKLWPEFLPTIQGCMKGEGGGGGGAGVCLNLSPSLYSETKTISQLSSFDGSCHSCWAHPDWPSESFYLRWGDWWGVWGFVLLLIMFYSGWLYFTEPNLSY